MTQSTTRHSPARSRIVPTRQKTITIAIVGGRFSGALAYALESALREPTRIRAVRADELAASDTATLPIPVESVVGDVRDYLKRESANCDVLVVECPDDELAQLTDPVLVSLRRDAGCLLVEVDDRGDIVRASGPDGWSYSAHSDVGVSTPSRRMIVVGVDGSPGGDAAVHWARSTAVRSGSSLRLVAACGDETKRSELQEALTRAWGSGADPDTGIVVRIGHPVDVLLDQSYRAELLVVGRHSTAGLLHSAMGGVGDSCARLATCPVVIVPSGTPST